jgi:hypothetical protein
VKNFDLAVIHPIAKWPCTYSPMDMCSFICFGVCTCACTSAYMCIYVDIKYTCGFARVLWSEMPTLCPAIKSAIAFKEGNEIQKIRPDGFLLRSLYLLILADCTFSFSFRFQQYSSYYIPFFMFFYVSRITVAPHTLKSNSTRKKIYSSFCSSFKVLLIFRT